jgi:ADP-ribose pyrophosphatase YjhB (NUDIX family)
MLPNLSDGARALREELVAGLAEAEERLGTPVERTYDLDDWGDDRRFWEMWESRKAEVILVICREGGRVVLQTKRFYPEGVFRLPTGGVREGERLLEAVRRELREETGLEASPERFLGVLHYRFRRGGRAMERASYVFLVRGGAAPLAPQDEGEGISAFRDVPLSELPSVARSLESLPGDWAVWGAFRALAHRFVAEVVGVRCEA